MMEFFEKARGIKIGVFDEDTADTARIELHEKQHKHKDQLDMEPPLRPDGGRKRDEPETGSQSQPTGGPCHQKMKAFFHRLKALLDDEGVFFVVIGKKLELVEQSPHPHDDRQNVEPLHPKHGQYYRLVDKNGNIGLICTLKWILEGCVSG